jgi:hypothetical protein
VALRVARGLFRLWLVLSVLWIGGVGILASHEWAYIPSIPSICETPANERSEDLDCSWPARVVTDKGQREVIQWGITLALVPPALLLALGSALVWAFRGFR